MEYFSPANVIPKCFKFVIYGSKVVPDKRIGFSRILKAIKYDRRTSFTVDLNQISFRFP